MSEVDALQLTVERLFNDPDLNGSAPIALRFSPDATRISWLAGSAEDAERLDLWEYNISGRQARCLVKAEDLTTGVALSDEEKARRERRRITQSGIVEYDWSPDGKQLLFPLEGNLYLYSLDDQSTRQLTANETFETHVKFSPDGNCLSFVRNQDLWLIRIADGHEIRLTRDGGGTVSNGVAEFIAQEEMHRFDGYWWSPDSQSIAFCQVDESPVQLTQRYEIGPDGFTVHDQRYPFAGTPNALVRVGIVDLEGNTRWLAIESDGAHYIARVNWFEDSRRLAIQVQSRNQQRLDLIVVDQVTMARQTVTTEASETWLNLDDVFHSLKNSDAFIWSSEQDGFNHLYRVEAETGKRVQLTSGAGPVTRLRGVDEKAGIVYFDGYLDTPLERHLYRASLSGLGLPTRITAPGYSHDVAVSADNQYFFDRYSSAATPVAVRLCSIDGDIVQDIFTNKLNHGHPFFPFLHCRGDVSFGQLTAADGQALHYRLIKPQAAASRKCPVIVTVYGGPGVQRVTNEWIPPWHHYMASRGYGLLQLDNRGSTNRGKAFEAPIFHAMGGVEVADQLTGVDFLKDLDWVDAGRLGVFGHSYGGFMTLMLMMKSPKTFRCGVSVAPVTDWRLYDTHYTERYLGNPNDSPSSYESSSVLPYAEGIGGRLLLIHGMADDNVLYTHTTRLLKVLQDANVQFDAMAYPGAKHGLSGRTTNIHRYTLMDDFFDRYLMKDP